MIYFYAGRDVQQQETLHECGLEKKTGDSSAKDKEIVQKQFSICDRTKDVWKTAANSTDEDLDHEALRRE